MKVIDSKYKGWRGLVKGESEKFSSMWWKDLCLSCGEGDVSSWVNRRGSRSECGNDEVRWSKSAIYNEVGMQIYNVGSVLKVEKQQDGEMQNNVGNFFSK